MMDQIQGDDPVESKAIVYNSPDFGLSVPLMLTAFEEEDNEALDQAGYRGRYVMFAIIDGGVQDCFTDPYQSDHYLVEGELMEMMLSVRRGWETHGQEGIDWTTLEHGGVYNKDDLGFTY